jgi:hypothetical protein
LAMSNQWHRNGESNVFFVLRIKHIEAVVPFEQDPMNEIAKASGNLFEKNRQKTETKDEKCIILTSGASRTNTALDRMHSTLVTLNKKCSSSMKYSARREAA